MKNYFKVLFIIILCVLNFIILFHFIWIPYRNKHNFEKSNIAMAELSQNSPFSISRIITYSSAYGENKNTTFQQSNWILDLFQYTDIALYIQHSGNELNSSNTVKKLFLENIHISTPKIGSSALYYLDSLNFGTPNIYKDYKLSDSIEFTVLNDSNEQNSIQYNTPVFFTDCSNPITLKYVNTPIKENYTITSNEPVFFNGKLLKMANISLEDLAVTIDFTIHIINHENEDFYYPFSLPISLEDEHNSIYEGNILTQKNFEHLKFMKK